VKLVVGLGNPGRRYEATRHSVGFRIVERFAAREGIGLEERCFGGRFGRGFVRRAEGEPLEVALLEPHTFMNRSGGAVAEALRGLAIEAPAADLCVVLDDVDLPFGRLRVRPAGGAGGHKGLGDVIEALGRNDFPRLRFGVGRPPAGLETAEWVLEPFSEEETARLGERIEVASEALAAVLIEGVEAAMNRFNRELSPEAAAPRAAEPAATDPRASRSIVWSIVGRFRPIYARIVRIICD
jgi:PTH1 family peptidyl-tRNA hydrolase